jgi:hypothetical protein
MLVFPVPRNDTGHFIVDFIFSSGNGVAVVDDEWFENATVGTVFGHECQIAPAEEVIWSKSFVNERERYDGSDVNHLIRAVGKKMDWQRIMRRFDRHWEVLFSHLILYRFSYPSDRSNVPDWVMTRMLDPASSRTRTVIAISTHMIISSSIWPGTCSIVTGRSCR